MHKHHDKCHLLLVGGGHSHLFVLRHFARHPPPDLCITLISNTACVDYSGMIPGVIAGHYLRELSQINLRRLSEIAGITWIEDEVVALNADRQTVIGKRSGTIDYDLLSLDIGSGPALGAVPGAEHTGLAVKPITPFLGGWYSLREQLLDVLRESRPAPRRITVIGGGAAGVEVALAMRHNLCRTPGNRSPLQWSLLTGSSGILPTYNWRARRAALEALHTSGFTVETGCTVVAAENVSEGIRVACKERKPWVTDHLIWAIHAGAQPWLRESGLGCTDRGFVSVNRCLQSTTHPTVFAAGDTAEFTPRPLPKSGIYAVRQGPPLAINLAAAARGHPMSPFTPQRHTLSLLSLGGRSAIASRSRLYARGRWVWHWKDFIDRRFMAQFDPSHFP